MSTSRKLIELSERWCLTKALFVSLLPGGTLWPHRSVPNRWPNKISKYNFIPNLKVQNIKTSPSSQHIIHDILFIFPKHLSLLRTCYLSLRPSNIFQKIRFVPSSFFYLSVRTLIENKITTHQHCTQTSPTHP